MANKLSFATRPVGKDRDTQFVVVVVVVVVV